MEKKQSKILETEKKQAEAIEKALRSYGYLFPQSDEEIESLDKIIGSTASLLPESLIDTTFLFSKAKKEEAKVISLHVVNSEDYYHQAYAARDGQDSISLETSSKMDEDIKKLKEQKSKNKKKKKK